MTLDVHKGLARLEPKTYPLTVVEVVTPQVQCNYTRALIGEVIDSCVTPHLCVC